jgi:hypothetical protein
MPAPPTPLPTKEFKASQAEIMENIYSVLHESTGGFDRAPPSLPDDLFANIERMDFKPDLDLSTGEVIG